MFESLFDALQTQLKSRNFESVKLPSDFEEHHDKDSRYVIRNWLFKSPEFRRWRITTLDGGESLQVFNSVAYPIFSNEKPILGVDILWFGKSSKLLAVIDYQPLIQSKSYLEKYSSRLKKIKDKYLDFDNTQMKNIYDSTKYFSPWVIICRGNNDNFVKDLYEVFTLILEEYLRMNEQDKKNYFLNSVQIKQKQIDYDNYSIEKDPAEKLFKKFFGESWTQFFIHNFLFALSEKHH